MYGIGAGIEGGLVDGGILMNRLPLPEEPKLEKKKKTTVAASKDVGGVPIEQQDWFGEFERSKYLAPLGAEGAMVLVQPSVMIHKAMQEAALDFQIKGKGKKTYKSLVKGSILLDPEFLVHENQECIADRRYVRIMNARIVRTRCNLPKWALSFKIIVLSDQVPFEVLNKILVRVGEAIGIGDYRPVFGRFTVTRFERLEEDESE